MRRMTNSDLTDIESRLMHQEKLLLELNTLVFRQQTEIDRLTKSCESLIQQLKDLRESSGPGEVIDTPPPHY